MYACLSRMYWSFTSVIMYVRILCTFSFSCESLGEPLTYIAMHLPWVIMWMILRLPARKIKSWAITYLAIMQFQWHKAFDCNPLSFIHMFFTILAKRRWSIFLQIPHSWTYFLYTCARSLPYIHWNIFSDDPFYKDALVFNIIIILCFSNSYRFQRHNSTVGPQIIQGPWHVVSRKG